jgi:hypothetical protein
MVTFLKFRSVKKCELSKKPTNHHSYTLWVQCLYFMRKAFISFFHKLPMLNYVLLAAVAAILEFRPAQKQ